MEKHLRVLTVTLDYPPPVLGGYGVMCSQVCAWLSTTAALRQPSELHVV